MIRRSEASSSTMRGQIKTPEQQQQQAAKDRPAW